MISRAISAQFLSMLGVNELSEIFKLAFTMRGNFEIGYFVIPWRVFNT
jgi:hypothetical protein